MIPLEVTAQLLAGSCVVIGALLTFILHGIGRSLDQLNEKLAAVVVHVEGHEIRIKALEERKG